VRFYYEINAFRFSDKSHNYYSFLLLLLKYVSTNF
jgi:hypothetical protein